MLRNALEPWHLLLVVAAIALLFGSKKLPDLARGLGRSMRILKAETRALHEDGPRTDAEPDPLPAIEPATAAEPSPPRPTTTAAGPAGTSPSVR
ncbi:Sec-independent protein translocase subunit TatA [Kitasatospora sp. NPDC002965]|uniref:Sec-independent protein translocase subunit TatA n=1 Tax=Kitasatospora sp. NPDC002965 TaxID=3154775 RepID=UPI0033A93204